MGLNVKDKLFVGLFSIGWSAFSYSLYKLGNHYVGGESFSLVKHVREILHPIIG